MINIRGNKCIGCKFFTLFDGYAGDHSDNDDQGMCMNNESFDYIFGYRGSKSIEKVCKHYETKPKRSLLKQAKRSKI